MTCYTLSLWCGAWRDNISERCIEPDLSNWILVLLKPYISTAKGFIGEWEGANLVMHTVGIFLSRPYVRRPTARALGLGHPLTTHLAHLEVMSTFVIAAIAVPQLYYNSFTKSLYI